MLVGSLCGCPDDGYFSIPLPDPPLPMEGLVADIVATPDSTQLTDTPDTGEDIAADIDKDNGTDTTFDAQEPYCGDGECNSTENWLICPADCESPDQTLDCLEKECEGDYYACKEADGCLDAVLCLVECADPADCVDPCLSDLPDITAYFVLQLISCGQEDCLPSTGPTCGDGNCQEPENYTNCPQDCDAPPPPEDCVFEHCEEFVLACVDSNACGSMMDCFIDCGSTPECAEVCATTGNPNAVEDFLSLVSCAFEHDCLPGSLDNCGDGFCGDDEDPFLCPEDCAPPWDGSCEGRCGDFSDNEPCQCDFACMEYDDCCEDYPEFCGTTNVGSCEDRCGDYDPNQPCQCNDACQDFGDCCGDYEEECGGGPIDFFACVEDNCGGIWETCLEQEECIGGFFCLAGCEDNEACQQDCLEEAGGDGQATLFSLIGCAVLNGCIEEQGPICGNDECEEGENPFNCPDDCDGPGGGPDCGDGVCEGPEPFYCPEDCDGETECGNGECEQGENPFNCPDDCDGPGGGPECGDGVCQGPEVFYCPEDCEGETECGNGECEQGENPFNCPDDCDGPGGGPECGDGICQGPEVFYCPEDCEPQNGCGVPEWVSDGWCDPENNSENCDWDGGDCCESTCESTEYPCGVEGYDCLDPEACENNPANCGPAECGDGICQDTEELTCPEDCVSESECGNDVCEAGEELICPEDCVPEPDCGNDVCEAGEELTCPEDCSSSTEDLLDCLGENCTDQLAACMNDPACTAVVDCVFACSGPAQSCVDTCVASASGFSFPLIILGGCAEQEGCL